MNKEDDKTAPAKEDGDAPKKESEAKKEGEAKDEKADAPPKKTEESKSDSAKTTTPDAGANSTKDGDASTTNSTTSSDAKKNVTGGNTTATSSQNESAALNISEEALNNTKKVVIQQPDDMKDTMPDWFKDATNPQQNHTDFSRIVQLSNQTSFR